VAHATPPALYTDNGLVLWQDTKLDRVLDTPLETTVDILLPRDGLEVGLVFGEVEGVDTTVEVRILEQTSVEQKQDSTGYDLLSTPGRFW